MEYIDKSTLDLNTLLQVNDTESIVISLNDGIIKQYPHSQAIQFPFGVLIKFLKKDGTIISKIKIPISLKSYNDYKEDNNESPIKINYISDLNLIITANVIHNKSESAQPSIGSIIKIIDTQLFQEKDTLFSIIKSNKNVEYSVNKSTIDIFSNGEKSPEFLPIGYAFDEYSYEETFKFNNSEKVSRINRMLYPPDIFDAYYIFTSEEWDSLATLNRDPSVNYVYKPNLGERKMLLRKAFNTVIKTYSGDIKQMNDDDKKNLAVSIILELNVLFKEAENKFLKERNRKDTFHGERTTNPYPNFPGWEWNID